MAEVAVRQVVNPATGDTVSLDRPTDELARFLWEAREFEGQLRSVKRVIGEELLRRQDSECLWTTRVGEFEIRGESPAPKYEWDGELLLKTLQALRDEDYITDGAIDQALEVVISYKPKANGLGKLLKLGGVVAERILKVRSESERERRAPSVRKVV